MFCLRNITNRLIIDSRLDFKVSNYCHSLSQITDLSDLAKTIDVPKINPLDILDESNIDFVNDVGPTLKQSFNLAAYVNSSETLQKLVQLNVDLSKIDKHTDLASYIVKCDFEKVIQPFIMLLIDNGVDIADVGTILNQNPFLLTNDPDDIQVRINYFLFRKFTKEQVASIFKRAALVFSLNTSVIDSRLGNLCKEYNLSPSELRLLINKYPKNILLSEFKIKKCSFTFNETMGFSLEETKLILLKHPLLWSRHFKWEGDKSMLMIFDFVHNQMGLSHEQIAKFPKIFLRRLRLIRPRHFYLKTLNRAQYDPTLPLYVPLSAFYEIDDAEFCLQYAKTSVNDYNLFLKSI